MSIVVSLIIGTLLGIFVSKADTICVKGGPIGCVLSSAIGAYIFGGLGNTFFGIDILSFNSIMIGFSIIGAILLLFIITRLHKPERANYITQPNENNQEERI